MLNRTKNMIKFIKKPIVFIPLILIIAGAAYYFYASRGNAPVYETVIAKKGSVMEEVSVTGRVKPSEEVALSFERGGKVLGIYVDVGDKVYAGGILIRLDSTEIQTQLDQAEANLKVQEVKVDNAKADLEEAKKNVIDKIQDAYTKSDDAVRTKVDQFIDNPKSNDPQLKFSTPNTILEAELKSDRKMMEQVLTEWKTDMDRLLASSYEPSSVTFAKGNLEKVKSFLEKAATVLNNILQPTATVNTWKTDVSTARTNINTAITNLSAAKEKLTTAQSDLSLQEAQVASNTAAIANYQAQLNKTALYSPINGVITKQEAKVGEIATSNTPIVSIISESKFEVEANIPEADIAKVKVGNPADITLDAYGDEVVFEAKVASIDPAETVVEGVTTYKVTIQFVKDDERIKSGMTANIDIKGVSQENVIVIPQQAVFTRNGDKLVRVLTNGTANEVKVKTGIKGYDGNVAITEGLNEGDQVILF